MMCYDEVPRLSFAINFNSKGHPLGPRMSGKLRTPLPLASKNLKIRDHPIYTRLAVAWLLLSQLSMLVQHTTKPFLGRAKRVSGASVVSIVLLQKKLLGGY